MDDTFEFLENVGDEYEPPVPNDDRLRCDKCNALMRDDEGAWDSSLVEYYCDICASKIDPEDLFDQDG